MTLAVDDLGMFTWRAKRRISLHSLIRHQGRMPFINCRELGDDGCRGDVAGARTLFSLCRLAKRTIRFRSWDLCRLPLFATLLTSCAACEMYSWNTTIDDTSSIILFSPYCRFFVYPQRARPFITSHGFSRRAYRERMGGLVPKLGNSVRLWRWRRGCWRISPHHTISRGKLASTVRRYVVVWGLCSVTYILYRNCCLSVWYGKLYIQYNFGQPVCVRPTVITFRTIVLPRGPHFYHPLCPAYCTPLRKHYSAGCI